MDDFGKWFNSFGSLTDEDTTDSATNDGSTDTNEAIGSGTEQTIKEIHQLFDEGQSVSRSRWYTNPYGSFEYSSVNPLREEIDPDGCYIYYDDDKGYDNNLICRYAKSCLDKLLTDVELYEEALKQQYLDPEDNSKQLKNLDAIKFTMEDETEEVNYGLPERLSIGTERTYRYPGGSFTHKSLYPLREEICIENNIAYYDYYDDDTHLCRVSDASEYTTDRIGLISENITTGSIQANLTLNPYVGLEIANQVEIMYLDPHGTQIHSIKCPSRFLDQDLKDEIIRDYRRQLLTQTLALGDDISCSDMLAFVCGYKDGDSMIHAWVVNNDNNKISWRKFIERELEHLDKAI